VIAVDCCADIDGIPYPMATPAELAETARLIRAGGRRAVTATVDVRDAPALRAAVDQAVGDLGRLDIVVANAGVCTIQRWDEVTPAVWEAVLGVNLTGSWNTCTAAIPHLVATGGGSMILISSSAGLKGQPFLAPYSISKHGLVGMMRVLANELASQRIRVNTVHPTGVDTPMAAGLSGLGALIAGDPSVGAIFTNALPVDILTVEDVTPAVLYLASDEARYVTGTTLPVDAGASAR